MFFLLLACQPSPPKYDEADPVVSDSSQDSSSETGDSADSQTTDTDDSTVTDTEDSGTTVVRLSEEEDHCPLVMSSTYKREDFGTWMQFNDAPDLAVLNDTVYVMNSPSDGEGWIYARDPSGTWTGERLDNVYNMASLELDGKGGLFVLLDGNKLYQGLPGAWAPLPSSGHSGGASQATAVDSQGRLHSLLSPDYYNDRHAIWDGQQWSFEDRGGVNNYATGVALSLGKDDGAWSSAWVLEDSHWRIVQVNPSGQRSMIYELPGNTLNLQLLHQATAPINGVDTPFLMTTDNNVFPQLGAFAYIGTQPAKPLVMVDGSGYNNWHLGGQDGDTTVQSYWQVTPIGVVHRGPTVVWLWARSNVKIEWETNCDSSGCSYIQKTRTADTFLEGDCQYNGGALQPFTVYTKSEEIARGRAVLTDRGLTIATYELVAASATHVLEEHATWYGPW